MKKREYNLHDGQSGAAITVSVIGSAPTNQVLGIKDGGAVSIQLTTAPATPAGNQTLIGFLAELLDVRKNQVEIVAGQDGDHKLVTILDLDSETVEERILRVVK